MSIKIWEPTPERADSTLIKGFMEMVGRGIVDNRPDYDELWRYSVECPSEFWSSVWDFCGVVGHRGNRSIAPAKNLMDVRFFPDASLNYAENLLRERGNETAMVFHGERGIRRTLSRELLRRQVARLQIALKRDGIGSGDIVSGIVPNTPEATLAMLATASVGAVWSSCSPDFGVSGVLDRFGQIKPKLLFCGDGYDYNGKWFDSLSEAKELAEKMPSIKRIVVLPYSGGRIDASRAGKLGIAVDDYLSGTEGGEPEFARMSFGSPLFVMFSSGTTGLPKCIVHSIGGTLLQHLKEHQLQCDLRPGDRLMYFSTTGWMMWNWMVSALATGATIVHYDGSPFRPDGYRLSDLARSEGLTHFGASAKYFDSCAKAGIRPADAGELPDLRVILSTGSPLSPDGFDYVYDNWKKDVCLSSIAGGTDIIGCFVGGSPVSPVFRGECQKRHLGMDVQVYDENGNSLEGRPGELVCASSHPSMPTGFFNDHGKKRYREAYFDKFKGVWHHGDWVELTSEQGLIFYGRSDATLNPGGVRIGTAEIYRPVERIDEVLEALAIGLKTGYDTEIVLFVKLRDGASLSDVLSKRIKSEIREAASPRHVPSKIIEVADIPRTKSGKIVELAVANVVNGLPVKNVHALANPDALEQFRNLPALRSP
ncbi:MAG: acetoacetate--CoA ligase [Albidovulum sp.]|nr:acetoacetate--CoA ligase [Albidovulum sp.]MDE0304613.1 acetoacetate--CoA ligase [Albidovulum sp.]